MEKTLKELVKEAVLEALIEFSNGGVAATADSGFEDGIDDGTGNGDDDDKKKDPIRPEPFIPPAGL